MQLFAYKKYSTNIVVFYYYYFIFMEANKLEELVLKSKNGDIEAFTELMLLVNNDLYKLAKTKLSNDDDINDIIQETMLIAFKNIKKLKDVSKFKFWIIKILLNCCNQKYKKLKKENTLNEKIIFDDDCTYYNQYKDNTSVVEDTMNFYDLINFLDKDEKTIIILFYNEGYTTKEISRLLHINENTIKSKILRAKKKIKSKYKGGEINGLYR